MIGGTVPTIVEVRNEIKKALKDFEGGGGGEADWNTLANKPTVIAAGADAAAARQVIGAGIGNSNLAVGPLATDAKAGNYVPAWSEVSGKPTTFAPIVGTAANQAKAGNYQPAWSDVTSKPAVIAAGADAATARAAIGAGTGNGTSNLALGTTSTTALKGDSFKGGFLTIEQITQAAYDALTPKVATTLYIIAG